MSSEVERFVKSELKNLKIGGKAVYYKNAIDNHDSNSSSFRSQSSEKAELYGKLYEQLKDEVVYCKNIRSAKSRRFYKKLSSSIYTLTDLICVLMNNGDINEVIKKSDKINKKFNKMTKNTRFTEENRLMEGKGIQKEALACVRSAVDVSAVLTNYYNCDERLMNGLNESQEIVNQIIEVVSSCVDDSSKQAAICAEKIMKYVYLWRNHIGLYVCLPRDIQYLREALRCANEWKNLPVVTKSLMEAKKNDIVKYDPEGMPEKIYNDNLEDNIEVNSSIEDFRKQDVIDVLLRAPDAFSQLDSIKAAMDRYVSQGSLKRKQNLEKQIEDKQKQVAQLQEKQQQIRVLFQNGGIQKMDAAMQIKKLNETINSINAEIYGTKRKIRKPDGSEVEEIVSYGLNGELAEINKVIDQRRGLFKDLLKQINEIEDYSDNLYVFTLLVEGIDFEQMLNLLNGRDITRKAIEEIAEALSKARIRRLGEIENRVEYYKAQEDILKDLNNVSVRQNVGRNTEGEVLVNTPTEVVPNNGSMTEEEADAILAGTDVGQPVVADAANTEDNILDKIGLDDEDR